MRRNYSETDSPKIRDSPNSSQLQHENPNPNWRIRIKQNQLVSQASTILLQRHSKFWAPLLKPLKLSSKFTPSLFHQILSKIQSHPKICFDFFNWAQKTLGFKPDLRTQCELIGILFGSELSKLGNPILNSVVRDYPPAKIVPLLIQHRKNEDFRKMSSVFNSVIECYCRKQMHLRSLQVYQLAKQYGIDFSIGTCNILLNLLVEKNELRLAWCWYASNIRNGVSGDQFTWSVIARLLYKEGKFERISKILDMGMYAHEVFDYMIDGYCRRGDFEAAAYHLNEMSNKGIQPSFCTFSSLLNGACKHQSKQVIDKVISLMVEKRLIQQLLAASDYDLIIQKLSDVGKTFAMEMFFKRAYDENIELQHATYGCMLKALLCEKDRVDHAIELYSIMLEKNIPVSESCYNELVIFLCKENPSHKINNLLVDVIRRGCVSEAKALSEYISKWCAEGRWREAEKIFDLVMDQGCLPDSHSCGYFVKHYCSIRQIDRAILLHKKLEGLKGNLDATTYNVFLTALFKERRTEETIKVFDYMRRCKVLSSESFSTMIKGLCQEKEFRNAMKLHDEMLELGLRPDQTTYKRLISGFR